MRITFFDTETTGLIDNHLRTLDKQPYIFEFFGLTTDGDGNELEVTHLWAKPPVAISQQVTKITGITDDDLADKPPFRDIASQIKGVIESSDMVVAHNATYDRDVTNFEMQRIGMTVNWPKIICTVELTEWLKGYRLKLEQLHEYLFEKKFDHAHSADADVRAMARCYFELQRRELI